MSDHVPIKNFRAPREATRRKPKPPFTAVVTTEAKEGVYGPPDGKAIIELFWLGKDAADQPDMQIAERQALKYAQKRRAEGFRVSVSLRAEGPPISKAVRRPAKGKGYWDKMTRQQFKDILP